MMTSENKIKKESESSRNSENRDLIRAVMENWFIGSFVGGVLVGLLVLVYFIAGRIMDDTDLFLIKMQIEFSENHPVLFLLYCIMVLVMLVVAHLWLKKIIKDKLHKNE